MPEESLIEEMRAALAADRVSQRTHRPLEERATPHQPVVRSPVRRGLLRRLFRR